MKTYINLCLVLLLTFSDATSLIAQAPGPRPQMDRENIESLKIAFLTKRLNLTPEEAQKFWPVYNKYSDELKGIRDDRANRMKDKKEMLDNMPDKDIEKLIDAEINSRQQELDLLKKYHTQFKSTLPVKKVALLYRSEEDFKRELMERIRERRGEKRGRD